MTEELSDDDFAAQLRALGGQPDAGSQSTEELASSPLYQQLREYHAVRRQKQVDSAIQGSAAQAEDAQARFARFWGMTPEEIAASRRIPEKFEPTPENLKAEAQRRFDEAGRTASDAHSKIAAAQAQFDAFNREHPAYEGEPVYPPEHPKTYEGTNYGLRRAELQTAIQAAQRHYEDAVAAQEEARGRMFNPASAMPGVGLATYQGLLTDIRSYAQSKQAIQGEHPTEYPQSPAAAPLEWGDVTRPGSQLAPKLAYRLAGSSTVLGAGIAGGAAGAAAGTAAAPGPGTVIGAIGGGATAAGVASLAKELGPHFLHRLQQMPNDPDAAFNAAMGDAAISGGFSAASWALFPARVFQGPVKHLLFQAFGVQPAVSVAQQATMNVRHGEPATKDLGQAAVEGAVGTFVPAAGHMAVSHLIGTPGRVAARGPGAAEVTPPPAMAEKPGTEPPSGAPAAAPAPAEAAQPPAQAPAPTAPEQPQTGPLTAAAHHIERMLPRNEDGSIDASRLHEVIDNLPEADRAAAMEAAADLIAHPERAIKMAQDALARPEEVRTPEATPAAEALPERAEPATGERPRSVAEVVKEAASEHFTEAGKVLDDLAGTGADPAGYFKTHSVEDPNTRALIEALHEQGRSIEEIRRELQDIANVYDQEAQAQESGRRGGTGQAQEPPAAARPELQGERPQEQTLGSSGAEGGAEHPRSATAGETAPVRGQPGREGTARGSAARPAAGGVTADLGAKFHTILGGSSKRGAWAGELGVTPEQLDRELIPWAIKEGLLRQTRNGVFKTAKAKEAAPNETKPASWVVRNKQTGEVLFETFDNKKVEALNTAKYEAVPIQQHLAEHNQRVKEAGGVEPPRPTLTPETHSRIEDAIDELHAVTGRKPSREVRNLAAAIEAADESRAGFRDLIEEVRADPEMSDRDVADIAAILGEDVSGLGKQEALGKIELSRGYLTPDNVREALARGEPAIVHHEMVSEAHAVLRTYEAEIPAGVPGGALTHIEPIGGPNGTRARLNFTTPDGRDFARIVKRSDIGGFRAAYFGSNRSIGLVHTEFGGDRAAKSIANALAGQVRHEVSHALRHAGLFTSGEWSTLLGHAESLRILDIEMRHFLRVAGDPNYRFAREGGTIRDAYTKEYGERDNFQELLDQEAVAHAAELYHHIQALPSDHVLQREVMPRYREIEPILQKMFSGEIAARDAKEVQDFDAGRISALTAYHGTPHDFAAEEGYPAGRFRGEKIGTGEGAQVYGYGHYFAQAEGTAKSYQENLSGDLSYYQTNEEGTKAAIAFLRQGLTPAQIADKARSIISARVSELKKKVETLNSSQPARPALFKGGDRPDYDAAFKFAESLKSGALMNGLADKEAKSLAVAILRSNGEGGWREGFDQMAHVGRLDLLPEDVRESLPEKIERIPRIKKAIDAYVVESTKFINWLNELFSAQHELNRWERSPSDFGLAAEHLPQQDRAVVSAADVIEQSGLQHAAGSSDSGSLATYLEHELSRPSSGRLYTVSLDVEPHELLDWDKPLSEQPEGVRKALEAAMVRRGLPVDENGIPLYSSRNPTGEAVHAAISSVIGEEKASAILHEAGIPGIRYLDQGSRGPSVSYDVGAPREDFGPYSPYTSRADAEAQLALLRKYGFHDAEIKERVQPQTHNYVIFPGAEDRIKITHKDGTPVTKEEKAEVLKQQEEEQGTKALSAQREPRDLDRLGYYSAALEAAKSLKQAKGTPEQMLSQLKKGGAKDAEIDATNLRAFLGGKKAVTKDEIVKFLEENRVRLNEVVREMGRPLSAEQYAREAGYDSVEHAASELGISPDRYIEQHDPYAGIQASGNTKWADYSLDPSNPTYRETVLHLPDESKTLDQIAREKGYGGWSLQLTPEQQHEVIAAQEKAPTDVFQSGHFPEPNITGHLMTSLVKDGQGRTVFNIDQIQSDWGQKLREGGVRDEAKIAELRASADDAQKKVEQARLAAIKDVHVRPIDPASGYPKGFYEIQYKIGGEWHPKMTPITEAELLGDTTGRRYVSENPGVGFDIVKSVNPDFSNLVSQRDRLKAELHTAEAATSGHPLVNTTSQWVNTTLRRALRQAIESGADAISIPTGDTVLSYNHGDKHGMNEFYNKIVPLSLQKIMRAADPSYPKPEFVDKLETPNRGAVNRGEGEVEAAPAAGGAAEEAARDYLHESGDRETTIRAIRQELERQAQNGTTSYDTETMKDALAFLESGKPLTPTHKFGFNVFPITDAVRAEVMGEGQPMFALGGEKGRKEVSPELRLLAEALAQVRSSLGLPEKQGRHGIEVGENARVKGGRGQSEHEMLSSLDDLATAGAERAEQVLGDGLREATHLNAAELKRLGGFEGFFREYIRNPDAARADAPNFHEEFEHLLENADPALLEHLQNLQEAVRQSPVQERLAQASIDPKFQETFGVPREHLFADLNRGAMPYVNALKAYRALSAKPETAAAFLARLPESMRSYVLFSGDRGAAALHPLVRAGAVNDVLHKMAADILRNKLRDTSSTDAGHVEFSLPQRQRLIDILTRLSGAEQNNAAVVLESSKEAVDRGEIQTLPILNDLRSESQAVHAELVRRLAKAKITPWNMVKSLYRDVAQKMEDRFSNELEARTAVHTEKAFNLKPGSVGAGDGGGSEPPPDPPSGGGFDQIPDRPFGRRIHNLIDRMGLGNIVRDLQMKFAPMTARDATVESRAAAKDFANELRQAQWESAHIDKELQKEFKPEELQAMWEAADEESVLRQQGQSTAGRGLDRLTERQRAKVKELQDRADDVYEAAKDVGVVEPDAKPLPSYVPRMIVMAGERGFAPPSKQKGGIPLDGAGRNLTTSTPNIKHRLHLTAAETEAAAKAKFGEDAMIVRDIRALNIATSRLQQAVAGKALINRIKEIGRLSGDATVSEGVHPADSPYKWFTLDHPAFRTWRPRLEKGNDGKWHAVNDEHGNPLFDQVPIYVRSDFEGPLRAVLSQKSGAVYRALMAIKMNSVGLIMYSPIIHNAVEFARAFPVVPGKMLTLRIYRDGYAAKNDVETMREFTKNGGVPIGDWRGHGGDVTELMAEPARTADKGWLTWGLRRYVSSSAADVTGKAMEFWHQTLLWDRISDLQMGLYTNIRDKMLADGLPRDAACKMAAHFANRYAGAIPNEAMSNIARKVANIAMFSRSFTVGNMGVMKDMFMGLPSDVQAQIARDGGLETLQRVRSISQRKAIAAFMLDVALFYAANSLLQNAFNAYLGDKEPILDGYIRRFKRLMGKIQENPLVVINPFYLANKLSATSDNEPGKEDRIKVGYMADGTAIYMRNPFGKIGEEFIGYLTKPITMFNNKQSTILHPLMQTAANDAGFGRKIYNPNAETPDELLRNAGSIAWHFVTAQTPELAARGVWDIATQQGNADTRRMAAMQTFGPLAGLTFSKGYPGGPAEGFLHHEKANFEYRFSKSKPAIRKMIQGGDLRGAIAEMTKLGVSQKDQNRFIRNTQNPGRISDSQMRNFYQRAAPEDREEFTRFRAEGQRQSMPQPMQ